MNEKLPKILVVLACDDYGPCDPEPTAVCPHCGSDGRYIYTFLCEDGSTRGAMAGCIQLFPRSPLADECKRALAAKHQKGYVSKWDQRIIDAIGDLRSGTGSVQALEAVLRQVKCEKRAWMFKKGYMRR